MTFLPTQNFVLFQSRSKLSAAIFLPDGVKDEGAQLVVLAVGPEVPKEPAISAGSVIRIRGDAVIHGVDQREKIGIVPYTMVMAVEAEAKPAVIETLPVSGDN